MGLVKKNDPVGKDWIVRVGVSADVVELRGLVALEQPLGDAREGERAVQLAACHHLRHLGAGEEGEGAEQLLVGVRLGARRLAQIDRSQLERRQVGTAGGVVTDVAQGPSRGDLAARLLLGFARRRVEAALGLPAGVDVGEAAGQLPAGASERHQVDLGPVGLPLVLVAGLGSEGLLEAEAILLVGHDGHATASFGSQDLVVHRRVLSSVGVLLHPADVQDLYADVGVLEDDVSLACRPALLACELRSAHQKTIANEKLLHDLELLVVSRRTGEVTLCLSNCQLRQSAVNMW